MKYDELSSFHRLLATRYDELQEGLALDILEGAPELARLEWPGPDEKGQPFVRGSTALHYAANDGKLRLCRRLIELGSDVNASNANWFRSVLAWAANNARIEAIKLLLAHGADPRSLDAVHAAAWGGSGCGKGQAAEYAEALRLLIESGADPNDRRYAGGVTPLSYARKAGNRGAIAHLESIGAES